MQDVRDRLKWLRARDGIPSVREAARRYGIGYEILKRISNPNGGRNLTEEQAEVIARFHRVSPGWLLFGEGTPDGRHAVPLVGVIGGGQTIIPFPEDAPQSGMIDATLAAPGATALEVRGDSMYPLARDGDIAVFGPTQRDVRGLVGEECAVDLQDGRRLFKIIARGSKPGHYDLMSYNAEPIVDVEIHAAAPFIGLRRDGRRSTPRRLVQRVVADQST